MGNVKILGGGEGSASLFLPLTESLVLPGVHLIFLTLRFLLILLSLKAQGGLKKV